MIHNSFRRIALAQGLLPIRAGLADHPDADDAPAQSAGVVENILQAREPAREKPPEGAIQV